MITLMNRSITPLTSQTLEKPARPVGFGKTFWLIDPWYNPDEYRIIHTPDDEHSLEFLA